MNFGNKVAKNWRKNIYYGNQVVKIVGEERKIIRNFGMPKMEGGKKRIVAMKLPKIGGVTQHSLILILQRLLST